jgi:hypothetical protein
MTTNLKIAAVLVILITTLACAFVQDLVFPPSPTATHIPPSPTEETLSPTEDPAPTAEPIDDPEPIDCQDDECLNACLDRLDEVLEISSPDPIGNSIYEAQGANFNLVIYQIDGNEIGKPAVLYVPSEYHKYQEDTAAHLRIWKFYAAIIPPELRRYVNEFVMYTDGMGSSYAWVRPSLRDNGYWQVGFDLLDSDYPLYLADSLVHETAHVLTLNRSQIPAEEDKYYYYDEKEGIFRGCEQFAVDGGCSLPDSYINLFYERFWEDSYAEWWAIEQEAQSAVTPDEYYEIMESFYDQHDAWFINTYAATDIVEDMAESFSFFVLNPKPAGEAIYDQKVAFYYEFPELVEYRRQIIAGLCAYVK